MDAIITLKKVCKSFGSHEIFHDFDLEVEQGEFVCITGESGKGKTTLLNIIGMLEQPDSGTVTINGVENPRLNKPAGRKLLKNDVFYVFQNYGLVEDQTVKYNLQIAGYFTKKTKDGDLEAALAKVGLGPEFLKSKIYTLSGGEQQRCALARMYLKNHSIILADEPTGSLDAANREKIMEILKHMNEAGKTVVVVTHDPEVTKCANRVVQL